MIGLAVLAEPLISVILTDKWLPAAILMSILAIDGLWSPITKINLNLLQAVGRSDLFLRLEVIKKTLSIGILLITIHYGLIWVCLGRMIYGIIALLINMYYTVDIIGKSYIEQIKDWFPTFFVAVLMGVSVYFAVLWIASPLMKLLVGIVVGLASYGLFSSLFKLEARKKIFSQLMNMIKR